MESMESGYTSLNFDTSTSCPSGFREHVGTDICTCGIESS